MSFVRWTSLLLATVVMTLAGCGGADTDTDSGDAASGDTNTTAVDSSTDTLEVAAILCGKCGESKGADSCCAADAETCEDCGMHKGTKLCCATLADEDQGKDICSGCGHVAEADHTCPDGEVCEDCGLHAGSAACCKLKS